MQKLDDMSKRDLQKHATSLGLEFSTKASREELMEVITNHNKLEEDTQMSREVIEATEVAEVIEGTEVQETVEGTEEKATYTLDDGSECSRSAFIRQEFNKGKSRQDLAKELGVKYYVVYSATANMFNAAHPEDGSGTGRGSVVVPKVNTEFKFVDAEGNVVETAEEAVSVPRADLMKELVAAGVTRSAIKEYFNVAYATVYAATKESGEATGTRERKFVTHPVTGEEVKRADYIRELFAQGIDRREIAKQLTKMTGDLVDYATVWAATKTKATEEVAEVATDAEAVVETPVDAE